MEGQSIEDLFRSGATPEAQPRAQRTAPAPAPVEGAAVEELFKEPVALEQPTLASTAIAPFVGFNRAISHIVGWPVDLTMWSLRQAGVKTPEKPFLGSEFVKDYLPKPIEPRSTTERVLQAGGEGAAYALIPQAGLEVLGMRAAAPLIKAPPTGITVGETAQKVFGARRPGSLSATGENIAVNVGGGAGAQLAREQLEGSKYQTLGELGGGIAGGGVAQLGIEAARAVPQLFRGLFQYLEPSFGEAAQRRVAAKQLGERATSPARALDVLENEPTEILPGSRPTTFEVTGDRGLGQAQRRAETQTPEPFLERQGEQAVAREQALRGVAPEGAPTEVPRLLRQQLEAIEAAETQAAEAAAARVRSIVERMGSDMTPEDAGVMMRRELQAAKEAARRDRSRLYDLVDPDNNMNVVATGLREASARIAAESADDLAKPLEGELKAIIEAASNVGDVVPFSALRQFDTRVTDAMRAERMANGESNTYRQLVMMKNSVMDAIENAAENQQRYQAEAIASGRMMADETLEARLRAQWGLDGRTAEAAGIPNISPESISALEAAKDAQKRYGTTFREGPVGEVLKPGASQGRYKMEFDAKVGPTFFRKGDTGAQAMRAFQRAAADSPGAEMAMREYITNSMLRETVRDGLIDEKLFNAWRQKHESALSAVPQYDRLFSSVAEASRNAAEIAAASRARIRDAQTAAFSQIIGATDDKTVVQQIGQIFGQPNAASSMRRLFSATSGDPEARAGLQRAVADYIRDRFITSTEAASSDAMLIKSSQFQDFVRRNQRALSQVLNPEQVSTLQSLANDLHRSNRSLTGSALRGRSTTAQDLPAATQKAQSIWSAVAKMTGPVVTGLAGQQLTGSLTGAVAGFAGGAIAAIAQTMRTAGMQKVDDLITEALLNPELARDLLRISTAMKGDAPVRKISDTVIKTLTTGARQPLIETETETEKPFAPPILTIPGPGNRPGRATGGAVNLHALAKAAKKHVTTSTESLLNEHDDTVAKALEIANKHI